MNKLFRQFGLPLILALLFGGGGQSQAQTRTVQLTERVVALSTSLQAIEESVFTLAPFSWFYLGGVAPGTGRSVVQAYDPSGAAQQEYLFPTGQTIYALHVLDDGALWGLTRLDNTGWRLVKFNFVGQLLQDVPLVFPKGFELPVPEGQARLHLVPGLDWREVHGVCFAPGPKPVFKTFTLSTYGTVSRTLDEGFRDRDGFLHRYQSKTDTDGKETLSLVWKRSAFPLTEPFYALDLWDDQVVVQTSEEGATGQSFLLAMNSYRPMWREPLKFPLRNNSYTFYHYNHITRKVTLYPYLDALMGTGWRVPGAGRSAPKVPRRD
jgi:hypothetical protein